jgi:hypothetical protein
MPCSAAVDLALAAAGLEPEDWLADGLAAETEAAEDVAGEAGAAADVALEGLVTEGWSLDASDRPTGAADAFASESAGELAGSAGGRAVGRSLDEADGLAGAGAGGWPAREAVG